MFDVVCGLKTSCAFLVVAAQWTDLNLQHTHCWSKGPALFQQSVKSNQPIIKLDRPIFKKMVTNNFFIFPHPIATSWLDLLENCTAVFSQQILFRLCEYEKRLRRDLLFRTSWLLDLPRSVNIQSHWHEYQRRIFVRSEKIIFLESKWAIGQLYAPSQNFVRE